MNGSDSQRWRESALAWPCGTETLVGVLTEPRGAAEDLAVVIVVGGPQYRSGSHRQFTQFARVVAGSGWPSLRFDQRGMGDSTGQPAGFENLDQDISSAIDTLQRRAEKPLQVLLLGLCDGASAALMYSGRKADPRVAALCLINPWVRTDTSLAAVHARHYYGKRLLSREFWFKLMRGGVGLKALSGLLDGLRALVTRRDAPRTGHREADFRDQMEDAFCSFRGARLVVLSGDDFTAREYEQLVAQRSAWQRASRQPGVQTIALAGADHTFSDPMQEERLLSAIMAWMKTIKLPTPESAPAGR